MKRESIALAVAGLVGFAVPRPAFGQPHDLAHDLRADGAFTAAAGVAWIASELLKARISADPCRWCATNSLDDAARHALLWNNPGLADDLSNGVAFGVVPAVSFGFLALASSAGGRLSNFGLDALFVAEAVVAAALLNQIVKFAVARERPFVHALATDRKGSTSDPADNNLSFYSGHTSLAFSLAVSAGTVASLRGYRWAPAVWSVGLPIAALAGYLRVAADKHYVTDVLVGMGIGGFMGFALPYFFHGRRAAETGVRTSASPLPGGGQVSFVMTW